MSGNDLNRRDFLKIMGWSAAGVTLAGCDVASTVTLEEGKETVVSYLSPEEYVIPGVGVWYASTCMQCAAYCGIHGRVREGRTLKLEGNPDSPLNVGKLCQMGQSGVQAHYNPDRITKPLARKDGKLAEISWDEAFKLLEQKAGPAANLAGERFAWVTGTVSGHQAVLLASHLEAVGSKNHFVHETIAPSVAQAVQQDMLGEALPRLALDKAKLILSFGADFLGTWVSPTHFATQYAKFRAAPRGILIQVEPKMTLTGGNADLWVPIRPGTEGVLALGLANLLLQQGADATGIPEGLRNTISAYDLAKVSDITSVPGARIERIAALLKQHAPSLVLAGAPVEGHVHGYEATAAVLLLNIILGNIDQTIVANGEFPFPQLAAKGGNRRSLLAFAEAAQNKALDVVFFHGVNPVYTAPAYLKLDEQLQNIPFKVAFTQFPDETAMLADLVIPASSSIEDWGTHVAAYQAEQGAISVQQPLMERLYPGSLGLGDLLLTLLKTRQADKYGAWADYYAYLRNAMAALPADYKGDAPNDEEFWNQTLQKGLLKVTSQTKPLKAAALEVSLPEPAGANADYPLHLVPYAQLGLWDGRHANLPWIQEAPDQISKVVWDSWAELHPTTAAKLGIQTGDIVEITSENGTIRAAAFVFKGIHPEAIAVPMGQGHQEYGRYAKGVGVNPLKILNPVVDAKTGELALYGTRVKIAHTGQKHQLVLEGHGNTSQLGRKLSSTVSAEQFRNTEGA
ncbi:MAG TPA: molybdopterin-dependent oxidoreductase [Gammaproteobacteria bacterium]|nr:molybdopterin-dependent oxidoreductase [Gammaproteobacteria bacterium]